MIKALKWAYRKGQENENARLKSLMNEAIALHNSKIRLYGNITRELTGEELEDLDMSHKVRDVLYEIFDIGRITQTKSAIELEDE